MSAITVTGPVLEVEHKLGGFRNDQGEQIDYDFQLIHVHLGGASIVEVKVKKDNGDLPLPKPGDLVSIEVELERAKRVIGKRYSATKN